MHKEIKEAKKAHRQDINAREKAGEDINIKEEEQKWKVQEANIYKKFVIIYGTPLTEIVSLRFRGQLAENSKILSTHNTIPELNHNEIEGFLKQQNHNKYLDLYALLDILIQPQLKQS